MTKLMFEGRNVVEEVGRNTKLHLDGIPDKEWELMRILGALEKLAGTYHEEIFTSSDNSGHRRLRLLGQPETNQNHHAPYSFVSFCK